MKLLHCFLIILSFFFVFGHSGLQLRFLKKMIRNEYNNLDKFKDTINKTVQTETFNVYKNCLKDDQNSNKKNEVKKVEENISLITVLKRKSKPKNGNNTEIKDEEKDIENTLFDDDVVLISDAESGRPIDRSAYYMKVGNSLTTFTGKFHKGIKVNKYSIDPKQDEPYGAQYQEDGTPYGQYVEQYGQYGEQNGQYGEQNGHYGKQYGQYEEQNGQYGEQYGQYGSPYGKYGASYGKKEARYGQYGSPYAQYISPYAQYVGDQHNKHRKIEAVRKRK